MAMNVGQGGGEDEVMVEMNTTPLIDVMLVLLVMLIITIPIQTHAVKLNMPNPNASRRRPRRSSIRWRSISTARSLGMATPSPACDALDPVFHGGIAQEPVPGRNSRQPNRLAKYDTVAKVLADASRNGVKKIGFSGEEQYMQ